MDDFTQFQLKEYENISQAHFKTNEVLATFYRYYLLITALPITTIGVSLIRNTEAGLSIDGRIIAFAIFIVSSILLSIVGVAVNAYIEGLRLDAILYARVVNSIRKYFFEKDGSKLFGKPVLPMDRDKPGYDGFGASFLIYYACALMNAAYFAVGTFSLFVDRSKPLTTLVFSCSQIFSGIMSFAIIFFIQVWIRNRLIKDKARKGF